MVVLGDFGRSPRMQLHTRSLSHQINSEVHVVAYGGSDPLKELLDNANVHIHTIPDLPDHLRRFIPRLLFLVLKVIHQALWLCCLMLLYLPKPRNILVQNPPAIPTLSLCWLAARRHGAHLVIDWHNFGYTIMRMNMAKGFARSVLLPLARTYEHFWGPCGDAHFCVTRAMQEELQANWGIPGPVVLYDRPPAAFCSSSITSTHNLFLRLTPSLSAQTFDDFLTPRLTLDAHTPAPSSSPRIPIQNSTPTSTPISEPGAAQTSAGTSGNPIKSRTVITDMQGTGAEAVAQPRQGRPVVLVTSTSWTADEDFGMLLDAMVEYNGRAVLKQSLLQLPDVLLLITGKGPQKEMYLDKIAHIALQKVAIRTLWLEAADYPILLGSADLGISLHASSSGLDLPMKVVDMFGCGLPVVALSYSSIGELVQEGVTGQLFTTADELADQLVSLLSGWVEGGGVAVEDGLVQSSSTAGVMRHFNSCRVAAGTVKLERLRRQVELQQRGLTWEKNWDDVAWSVLKPC